MKTAIYFATWLIGTMLIGSVFAILGALGMPKPAPALLSGMCGAVWGFAVVGHYLEARGQ